MKYSKLKMAAMLLIAIFIASCNGDEQPPKPKPESKRIFTLGLAVGSGRTSKTYIQGITDPTKGSITFKGKGFEVPSQRTARIFSSADGKYIFNLSYGGGRIYKFEAGSGKNYKQMKESNVNIAMGTNYPRWTKASEERALLHRVQANRIWDETKTPKVFKHTQSKIRLVSIDLKTFQFDAVEEFETPTDVTYGGKYDYVGRIDGPVIAKNKVYYGMARWGYDPTGKNKRPRATINNVQTLVADYPSLKNPKIITTTVGGAKGNTNGYRTPVAHLDEKGEVYQIISVSDKKDDCHILKIANGKYDESYDFNLSKLLGFQATANGWFYVGKGIGYVPYANMDAAQKSWWSEPVWGVARVDLYKKTAVKMNVPAKLWLTQYQNGVVHDGKFYMALAPKGENGHIYIFDSKSTSPDGFTQGASLATGADSYYIGIY